jgi:predicted ATPase
MRFGADVAGEHVGAIAKAKDMILSTRSQSPVSSRRNPRNALGDEHGAVWRDQGKRAEAHELLAPVCGWFTEGFNTRDLKEAKGLLEESAA